MCGNFKNTHTAKLGVVKIAMTFGIRPLLLFTIASSYDPVQTKARWSHDSLGHSAAYNKCN